MTCLLNCTIVLLALDTGDHARPGLVGLDAETLEEADHAGDRSDPGDREHRNVGVLLKPGIQWAWGVPRTIVLRIATNAALVILVRLPGLATLVTSTAKAE